MNSELKPHFVEFFNRILVGELELPDPWFVSRVAFLAKVAKPSTPKDLWPIVLSPVVCKVFTKLLLGRMKALFPPMASGQILGEPGAQVLDASLAVPHAMRLANERAQPLCVCKLDISEAFDTISHSAVAIYLARLGPCREAHLLLKLVLGASVRLSLCGIEWTQRLQRGIVQGAPYSAELFARVVDSNLAPVHLRWQLEEDTWLRTYMGCLLILYADDIAVLATSCAQMTRMIEEVQSTLALIGLRLSPQKSQVLKNNRVSDAEVSMHGEVVKQVHTFVYLGA